MSFVIVTGWGGVDPIDTLLLWWLKGDSWDYWRSPHMTRKVCPPSIVAEKLPLILKILGPGAVFFLLGCFWGGWNHWWSHITFKKWKVGIPKKSRYFLDKFSAHVFPHEKTDFSQDSTFYAVKNVLLTKTFQVFFVGRNHVVVVVVFGLELSKPYVAQTWR